jgi:hypothetical protein
MEKRRIEVFTAQCPMCDPTVELVRDVACDDSCEVTVYDVVKQCDDQACISKAKEYGVQRIPAVAVDGKLLSCCQGGAITRESLINAGVGQKQE